MKLAPQLISRALRVGRFEFPIEQTEATTRAAANFELNRAALDRVWPRANLALPETLPELEWLYARDGALSARHIDGQWFGNVSIPRLAAERMLSKLQVTGTTAVLLAPTHAEQVRAALARMTEAQALIVVIPTERTAGVIAACADFSAAINERRLWLACGPDWADELRAVFDENEGLAPAGMMIRVPGLNAVVVELIQKPCEAILAQHAQSHRQGLVACVARPRALASPPTKLLVVCGRFALWDDASALLGAEADHATDFCLALDNSVPARASTLHLARTAESCDAIITANAGRSDYASPPVPADVPWVTWATARVPAFVRAAAGDLLVVADDALRSEAATRGWPVARVRTGAERPDPTSVAAGAGVSIIADLPSADIPKSVEEMSSHRLAWEWGERALRADPFAFRGTPDAFIDACALAVGVPADTLPRDLFIAGLFGGGFVHRVAEHLLQRGASVRLFGTGWDRVPGASAAWRGRIANATQFAAALAETTAILDVWPASPWHRARRCGRPTVRCWNRTLSDVLHDVQTIASPAGPIVTAPTMSLQAVRSWLAEGGRPAVAAA